MLETVKSENMNIHQSRAATQDVVYRVPIAHCELIVINMYAPTVRPHPITDSPITTVCNPVCLFVLLCVCIWVYCVSVCAYVGVMCTFMAYTPTLSS